MIDIIVAVDVIACDRHSYGFIPGKTRLTKLDTSGGVVFQLASRNLKTPYYGRCTGIAVIVSDDYSPAPALYGATKESATGSLVIKPNAGVAGTADHESRSIERPVADGGWIAPSWTPLEFVPKIVPPL